MRYLKQFATVGAGLAALALALTAPSAAFASNAIPTASTGVASSLTTHTAMLNAMVNPNGLTTT